MTKDEVESSLTSFQRKFKNEDVFILIYIGKMMSTTTCDTAIGYNEFKNCFLIQLKSYLQEMLLVCC